jgi:hypothetical protein
VGNGDKIPADMLCSENGDTKHGRYYVIMDM